MGAVLFILMQINIRSILLVHEVPFTSESKFQLSVHSMHTDSTFSTPATATKLLLVMKGAPEKIIERCSTILIVDEEVEVFYVKSALILISLDLSAFSVR